MLQGSLFQYRVEIARDQLDQGRFARPVGADDGSVLTLRDGKGHAVQRDPLVAPDRDVVQFYEWDQSTILISSPEEDMSATTTSGMPLAWVEQLRQGS